MLRGIIFSLHGVIIRERRHLAVGNLFRHNGISLPRHATGHGEKAIVSLLQQSDIQDQWISAKGRCPQPEDIDALLTSYYDTFLPQAPLEMIPGAGETLSKLRYERDMKLGVIQPYPFNRYRIWETTQTLLRSNGIYWHYVNPSLTSLVHDFHMPCQHIVGVSDDTQIITKMRGLGLPTIRLRTQLPGHIFPCEETIEDITNLPRAVTEFNERCTDST